MSRSSQGPKAVSRRIVTFLLLGAVLLAASPGALHAYNLEDRVQRVTLENGMRVLLVERHTSPPYPSTSATLWVP